MPVPGIWAALGRCHFQARNCQESNDTRLFRLASPCEMNIFNPLCLSIYKSYVSSAVRGIYLLYYKGLFRMLLYLSHLRVPEAGQGKDTQA